MVQYFLIHLDLKEIPPDIKSEMIIYSDDYQNLENSLNKMFDLNQRVK